MATTFLDEKQIVTATQEIPISSASTWEIVLEGVPSPPDELGQLLQAVNNNSFTKETLQAFDEARATQNSSGEAALKSTFTNLTPTASRASTFAKNKVLTPTLPFHRDPTPRLSIDQNITVATTSNYLRSSIEVSNIASPLSNDPITVQCNQPLPSCTVSQHFPKNDEREALQSSDTKSQITGRVSEFQRITTITRTCWISNIQMPPAEYITHWTEHLKGRIDTMLLQRLPPANDNQSSLVLSLCMIKTRQKDLRPSILVTCCGDNQKRGKAVKKILSELGKTGGVRGPEGVDLPYFVRVEGGFKLLMAGSTIKHPVIEIKLPTDSSTLCGMRARIRPNSTLEDHAQHIKFTLGGVIRINQQAYFLTAAHPFLPSEPTTPECDAYSFTSSTPSASSISDISSFEYDGAEDLNQLQSSSDVTSSTPTASQGAKFTTLEHSGLISGLYSPYSSQLDMTPTSSRTALDWAVLLASDGGILTSPQGANTFQLPGHDSPTVVEEFMEKSRLRPTEVWIAAGSGLYSGALDLTPASLMIQSSMHEVRKIILTSPLRKGDSGSWVFQDGQVCGLILAGSDSPPLAYMALMEDILRDISKRFPEPFVVELSTNPLSNISIGTQGGRGDTIRNATLAGVLDLDGLPIAPITELLGESIIVPVGRPLTGLESGKLRCEEHLPVTLSPPSASPSSPSTRLNHQLYRLSCGILGKTRSHSPELTSTSQSPVVEVVNSKAKPVRHYPRSPARSRKESPLKTSYNAPISGEWLNERLSNREKRA